MLTRRHMLASAGALALGAATGEAGAASNYANQPIHILVGYAAGGGVDIIARLLQDPLKSALGQTVIVEPGPRPGAPHRLQGAHPRSDRGNRRGGAGR